jgi:hypothetical protein
MANDQCPMTNEAGIWAGDELRRQALGIGHWALVIGPAAPSLVQVAP